MWQYGRRVEAAIGGFQRAIEAGEMRPASGREANMYPYVMQPKGGRLMASRYTTQELSRRELLQAGLAAAATWSAWPLYGPARALG